VHDKPFLSVLTQLAISLVFDLGLNKRPFRDPDVMFNFKPNGCPKPSPSTVRTMEERRAVLGCFLITSMYIHIFPCFPDPQAKFFQHLVILTENRCIALDTAHG